jgi:hypothetical protein
MSRESESNRVFGARSGLYKQVKYPYILSVR